jgi:hypothetical protein
MTTPTLIGLAALLATDPAPAQIEVSAGQPAPTTAQLTEGGHTFEVGVRAGTLWCGSCGVTVDATGGAIRGHRC